MKNLRDEIGEKKSLKKSLGNSLKNSAKNSQVLSEKTRKNAKKFGEKIDEKLDENFDKNFAENSREISQKNQNFARKFGGKSRKKLSPRAKKILLISAIFVIILAIFLAIWLIFFQKSAKIDNAQISAPQKSAEKPKFYSPLTGLETAKEKISAPVFAVMIENSPDARPQSGLKDAGAVFEAVAEGGITRFVALYQESEPQLIGPVRSVRAYYLEWAAAFDAGVAHVGGSDDALAMVRSGNYGVDLDEFYNSAAFWRARDRYAPHNVYTDYAHLSSLMSAKNKTSSKFDSWAREDKKNCANSSNNSAKSSENSSQNSANSSQTSAQKTCENANPATEIDFSPSGNLYAVHYDYDAGAKNYKRSVGGAPHLDREQGQIAPDVVVALRVSESLASDGLHAIIQTAGENDAFVFQNGEVIEGKWRKSDAKSQIEFFTKSGEKIKLARGQVWITAVGEGKNISWK